MEYIDIARYVGALLVVLALLGLAALAARRYGVPGVMKANAVRRLAVVESLMIGPRQKLLLIKRDNREHLLFIGPQGATLVENSDALEAPVS
ncbi:MAG TPA: flagellar biosynthetic protein FliO [Rhizomicrobium sp.]|jgi:flagellar protein FliO/FliZ